MPAKNNPRTIYSKRRVFSFPVQLKYAVMLSVVAGVVNLSMIFIMAWFMQRNYSLFLGDELGVSAQVIRVVQKEQELLEISLFLLFIFAISITFAASFFVTRKLTGPMAALQRHLHQYSQGDWSRSFRLRKNDEFKELERIVNQMRLAHLESTDAPKKKVI